MSTHPAGYVTLPDGGRVHWTSAGDPDAEAVLLVRPLGGTMALWGAFRASLGQAHRVIAFDHRGAGRSSRAPVGHGTRSMARDALAVLDALEISRAHVFGISLGGMVATWLAAEAPARVGALVLASTLPRGVSLSAEGAARGLSMARALARRARDAEVELARRVLSREFRHGRPERVREIERVIRGEPASHAGLVAMLAAAATHDAREALPRITAPTLVLAGDRDPLLSRRSQRVLLREIPHAEFEVVPGVGHDLTLEDPEGTAVRVARFLARRPLSTARAGTRI